jgi:hypothetical protein
MKLILLMFLSGSTSLMFGSQALAEKYLGEFCWQVFNEEGKAYWSYQFGVYKKDGGHFVLIGTQDYQANGVSASHGNAVFVGDSIKLTLVSSDHEEGNQIWSETFAAKLDKTTLSGTWNSLGLEIVEGTSEVRAVHFTGTVNLVNCQ